MRLKNIIDLKKFPLAKFRQILIVVIGIGLIGYGGVGFWQKYRTTHRPNPLPPSQQTVTNSTDSPDETSVPCAEYKVSDDMPRRIILPSIGAEGCIQKVGVDQNNAVAVPSNIHLAGWFVNSVKPGDEGVSLIDGHVRGKYGPAIFTDLKKLNSGDKFQVEFGDQSIRNFEVVSSEELSIESVVKQMFTPKQGVDRQLNLITCGGNFDRNNQHYDKRVLFVSKIIE